MNKESIKQFGKSVEGFLVRKSPEILIGVGITSMITATVMAVKATPKALILIEEKKRELKVDKLSVGDTVKAAWKCYIPAVATTAVGAGCIIGSSTVSAKRNAALAAAYTLSESTLKEYQTKVIETIGEKKEHLVRDEISKEQLRQNPVSNNTVVVVGNDKTLCYDPVSKTYFKSSINKIDKAINRINDQLLKEGYVSHNDFLMELGLEPNDESEEKGWRWEKDGMVEWYPSSQIADNDEPCIVINYYCAPHYRYDYSY